MPTARFMELTILISNAATVAPSLFGSALEPLTFVILATENSTIKQPYAKVPRHARSKYNTLRMEMSTHSDAVYAEAAIKKNFELVCLSRA